MSRYLNMFMVIGVALIAVSVAGFVTSNRFLTEPGQPLNPTASLVYLGAGVLMIANGVLSIRNPPTPAVDVRARQSSGATLKGQSEGSKTQDDS